MTTFHQRKFFTLLELLSVIGIIAIVAGIILGGMNYAGRRADQAKTISLMTQLEMALDAFKQDRGYYPPATGEVRFFVDSATSKLNIMIGSTAYEFENSNTGRAYMEVGQVPTCTTAVAATDPNTPYKDAWGNAFQYRCPCTNNTSSYDLWSGGPTTSTDDDICNWKRN